jgi:hypothetical protein
VVLVVPGDEGWRLSPKWGPREEPILALRVAEKGIEKGMKLPVNAANST